MGWIQTMRSSLSAGRVGLSLFGGRHSGLGRASPSNPTYDGIGGGRRALAWQVGNPGAVAALAYTQMELRA